jgi:hypothetical protein
MKAQSLVIHALQPKPSTPPPHPPLALPTFLGVLEHVCHQALHHIGRQHLQLVVNHDPGDQRVDQVAQHVDCNRNSGSRGGGEDGTVRGAGEGL